MIIDTHIHLFDPQRYPFAAEAGVQPVPQECAGWPQLDDLLQAHDVNSAVLVAPTAGYGHALDALVGTLKLAEGRLTGVCRLRGTEEPATLQTLAAAGVRGVRLDLRADGTDFVVSSALSGALKRWAELGWWLQVQADAAQWAVAANALEGWNGPLVIDHCGLPDTTAGLGQAGFAAVCDLAQRANTWAKLSGAFRFSAKEWPHDDTTPYAQALVNRFGPERCIWGSDWPFVRVRTRLDYGPVLAHLARWVPDPQARTHILQQSARWMRFTR